jgi:hypothetical protein
MQELEAYYGIVLTSEERGKLDIIKSCIKAAATNVVKSNWELGKHLTEAKEIIRHGNFLDWVQNELGLAPRVAQQRMQLYKSLGPVFLEEYGNQSYSTLLKLAQNALPEEQKKEIITKIERGERVSLTETKPSSSLGEEEVNERVMRTLIEPLKRKALVIDADTKMPENMVIINSPASTYCKNTSSQYELIFAYTGTETGKDVIDNLALISALLKEGGDLFVFTYPTVLAQVITNLSPLYTSNVQYYWHIASLYHEFFYEAEFRNKHMNILWYNKGYARSHKFLPDTIQSDRDNTHIDLGENETAFTLGLLGDVSKKSILIVGAESKSIPTTCVKAGGIVTVTAHNQDIYERIRY